MIETITNLRVQANAAAVSQAGALHAAGLSGLSPAGDVLYGADLGENPLGLTLPECLGDLDPAVTTLDLCCCSLSGG